MTMPAAWVGLLMHFSELLDGIVGVHLCGGQAGMAKQAVTRKAQIGGGLDRRGPDPQGQQGREGSDQSDESTEQGCDHDLAFQGFALIMARCVP